MNGYRHSLPNQTQVGFGKQQSAAQKKKLQELQSVEKRRFSAPRVGELEITQSEFNKSNVTTVLKQPFSVKNKFLKLKSPQQTMYTSNLNTSNPNSRLGGHTDVVSPQRPTFALMTMGDFDPSYRRDISDSNPNKTQTQFNMNNVLEHRPLPSFAQNTISDFKVEGHSFNPDSDISKTQTFFNIQDQFKGNSTEMDDVEGVRLPYLEKIEEVRPVEDRRIYKRNFLLTIGSKAMDHVRNPGLINGYYAKLGNRNNAFLSATPSIRHEKKEAELYREPEKMVYNHDEPESYMYGNAKTFAQREKSAERRSRTENQEVKMFNKQAHTPAPQTRKGSLMRGIISDKIQQSGLINQLNEQCFESLLVNEQSQVTVRRKFQLKNDASHKLIDSALFLDSQYSDDVDSTVYQTGQEVSKALLEESPTIFTPISTQRPTSTIHGFSVAPEQVKQPIQQKKRKSTKPPLQIIANTDPETFDFRDMVTVKKQVQKNSMRKYIDGVRKEKVEEKRVEFRRQNDGKDKPVKRKVLEKRSSFAEANLKYPETLELTQNVKEFLEQNDIIEISTKNIMKRADKYPIMEPLLCRPDNYEMRVDSIIKSIYNEEKYVEQNWLKAPPNSEASDEGLDWEDEEIQIEVVAVKEKVNLDKYRVVDPRVWQICNYDTGLMKDYPFKAAENKLPLFLLKKQGIKHFKDIQTQIKEMFSVDDIDEFKHSYFPDTHIQLIFEWYCHVFKAAPLTFRKFMSRMDTGYWKVSFINYSLNEPTLKAIACLLPFLVNVEEIHLENNKINDHLAAVLIFSCFMNPVLKSVRMNMAQMRGCATKAMSECAKEFRDKLQIISVQNSVIHVEHMQDFITNMGMNKRLTDINLAGCCFSTNSSRQMADYMIYHSNCLRDLNLAYCKISYQGTRYIINALNRNVSIRTFNFSHNDMTSATYEFCVKMGAIITRHPNLMHLDLTQCMLKREEMLFIGIALSMSKTMLSLHITGNNLPYYDRIFLRSLIAAKVQYRLTVDKGKIEPQIKNNKEYNTVLQLSSQGNYSRQMRDYICTFNSLDEEREGLDFEIHDLMTEMNAEEQYENLVKSGDLTVDKVPQESKLGQLLNKMKTREQTMQRQMQAIESASKADPQNKQIQQHAEKFFEKPVAQTAFTLQDSFKVDRQRRRAELEIMKKDKERSQGDMALAFMGINQIANQLFAENPMNSYMQQVIFTRILGHDDIEQGSYWTDCNQCWICNQWNKLDVKIHPMDDKTCFDKQLDQLQQFEDVVRMAVDRAVADGVIDGVVEVVFPGDAQEESLQQEKVEEIIEKEEKVVTPVPEVKEDPLAQEFVELDRIDEERSIDGQTEGRVTGSTGMKKLIVKKKKVEIQNSQNPIAPQKVTKKQLKKRFYPEKFKEGKDVKFENMDLSHQVEVPDFTLDQPKLISLERDSRNQFTHMSFGQSRINTGRGDRVNPNLISEISQFTDTDAHMQSQYRSQIQAGTGDDITHQSTVNVKRRVRGQPTLIERQVFYRGAVYIIEEEMYSDSDNSSVYTSEDSFSENDDTLDLFCEAYPLNNPRSKSKYKYKELPKEIPKEVAKPVEAKEKTVKKENKPKNQKKKKKNEKAKVADQYENFVMHNPDIPLNQLQKEYQNKLAPKHYLQKQKQQRIDKFETQEMEGARETLDKRNARTQKRLLKKLSETKDESNISKINNQLEQFKVKAETSFKKMDQEDIYFISSACEWMPIKMKTMRTLAIEKISMTDAAPPATLNFDNTSVLYSNFVPAGHHYFYFVQGKQRCFLSPHYQIVRFKDSNVFLNRITVLPKLHLFDSVFVIAEGTGDAEIFIIEHSVFAKYEVEQYPRRTRLIANAFDADWNYTKLSRLTKGDHVEFKRLKSKIYEHYERIKDIWLYEIGRGESPMIGWNDFTIFGKRTGIQDGTAIDTATFDRTFILTNVNTHGLTNSSERNLQRYEFVEVLVRLATIKYKDKLHLASSFADALEMLLEKDVYPHAQTCDGWKFRMEHVFNCRLNEILRKNLAVIEKIYKQSGSPIHTHAKKKFITVQEVREYIHAMGLVNLSFIKIGMIFYESLITPVDTLKKSKMEEMMPHEFLVFICRITYEYYRKTPYHNELMQLKVDKMMPNWLAPISQTPLFSFNQEFEYDIKVKKKAERKRKKALGIESDNDEDYDSEEDSDKSPQQSPRASPVASPVPQIQKDTRDCKSVNSNSSEEQQVNIEVM